MKCPQCGTTEPTRVIYAGFPLWFCEKGEVNGEQCSCLWGFWSFILSVFGFNGYLFCYNHKTIGYPEALWQWLFGEELEVE